MQNCEKSTTTQWFGEFCKRTNIWNSRTPLIVPRSHISRHCQPLLRGSRVFQPSCLISPARTYPVIKLPIPFNDVIDWLTRLIHWQLRGCLEQPSKVALVAANLFILAVTVVLQLLWMTDVLLNRRFCLNCRYSLILLNFVIFWAFCLQSSWKLVDEDSWTPRKRSSWMNNWSGILLTGQNSSTFHFIY